MKKALLSLAFVAITIASYAQIDLKTRPLGLIFGNYSLSAEYAAKENMGLEIEPSFSSSKLTIGETERKFKSFGANLYGKYYFSPDKGTDKICAGLYMKYNGGTGKKTDALAAEKGIKSTNIAIGMVVGYKWVSKGNIILGFDGGFGRALVRKFEDLDNPNTSVNLNKIPLLNWDLLLRLTVGYRLAGNGK